MAGIYVHLPFCPYICPYCDFAKWPHRRSVAQRYLKALHSEIDRTPFAQAQTVYFGGGTPNTYAPSELTGLIAHFHPEVPFQEITIELNPELVRENDVREYVAAGVTRVSIGVQSFVPQEARTLGRKHSLDDIRRAVQSARSSGVRSVSIDLMFGVPGQTVRSWQTSLDSALSLGVDHISTYGLTIEAGTPFASWRERQPQAFADDESEAELYAIAIDALEEAGFEHYEISNFAKPSHRSLHNANYWANGEYIGFGVGAASYRDGVRSVHTRDLHQYIDAALAGKPIPGEAETLAGSRRAGEAAMLALRTSQGVSFESFKRRYGVDFLDYYKPVIEEYRAAGLLDVDANHVALTRRGRFMANDVCAAFIVTE